MGKPIIYGYDMSPPVRAVLLTANAIGLDYEFREVNLMAGEHKTEEYLKMNPQHTIPTLEDDGKYMWDSHAIATYLVQKYGNDKFLYSEDEYKRAVINQRMHFDSGVLFPRFIKLVNSLRTIGSITDDDKKSIEEAYEFLEKFLEKDLYLGGNIVTVADLCCIASISTANLAVPIDANKFPKLGKWMQRMSLLPYYHKTNSEGLKKATGFVQNLIANAKKVDV